MKLQTFDYKQISTRNFIYKQKLSEVISQGSSGSVVKDAGVRYGGPWFELWYVFFVFFYIFCAPFLPRGDCPIRVSGSHDFILA